MTRTLSTFRTHDDREIPTQGTYTIDPAHTTVEFVLGGLEDKSIADALAAIEALVA